MKKVFLPINTTIPIKQQFPSENTVWGNYKFVIGDYCEDYDILVVLHNIPSVIKTHCPKQNTVIFTCEPPSVLEYPKKYLNQFGHVFSFQEKLLQSGIAQLSIAPFPWMLSFDFFGVTNHKYDNFNYFKEREKEESVKKNKFCLLTSNKRFTKAHCERIRFAEKLKRDYPEMVDIYGLGYEKMDVKYDVLSQYKYTIVIENLSYPYYWTEKIADAVLADCYPVYYGAPNINDYYDKDGLSIIDIKDFSSSVKILKNVLDNDLYDARRRIMSLNKKKVLFELNMFAIIANALDQISFENSLIGIERDIFPMNLPKTYLIKNKISRFWYENIYRLR